MLAATRLLIPAALLLSVPLAGRPDENSVCGQIQSGELTVPSYRFTLADHQGTPLADFAGEGVLEITEGLWRGGWFEGWWDEVHHDVSIAVAYDPGLQAYVSRELRELIIVKRKKGPWWFRTDCWDRVRRLTFTFDPPEAPEPSRAYARATFVFNVPNGKLAEIGLPDPGVTIRLTVNKRTGGQR